MARNQEIVEESPIKKRSRLDKLLLGFVVGGAVGSILGVALAPKKGRDTRRAVRREIADVLNKQAKSEKNKKGFWHTLHRWFK